MVEEPLGDDDAVEDERTDGHGSAIGSMPERSRSGRSVHQQPITVVDHQYRYRPGLVLEDSRKGGDQALIEDVIDQPSIPTSIQLSGQTAQRIVHPAS